MLINIDAWPGAGKSVMLALLDGHPDVFCSPVHEFTYVPLSLDGKNPDWMTSLETEYMRKKLAVSGYYRIEFHARKKEIPFCLSSEHNSWIKFPFDFDFYGFEREWNKKLQEDECRSLEDFVSMLYEVMQRFLCGKVKPYVASMAQVKLGYLTNMLEAYPKHKTIHVRRNVEDIFATRVNRKNSPARSRSIEKGYVGGVGERLFDGELEKILKHHEQVDKLSKINPDKILVIEFEELVCNTEKAMKKVSHFLGVTYHDCLYKPSIMGFDAEADGVSLVGNANDKSEEILDFKSFFVIRIMRMLYPLHRVEASPLNVLSFLRVLLKKLRSLLR